MHTGVCRSVFDARSSLQKMFSGILSICIKLEPFFTQIWQICLTYNCPQYIDDWEKRYCGSLCVFNINSCSSGLELLYIIICESRQYIKKKYFYRKPKCANRILLKEREHSSDANMLPFLFLLLNEIFKKNVAKNPNNDSNNKIKIIIGVE